MTGRNTISGKADDFAPIRDIIRRHARELDKPGVIGVRPGYAFKNGWISTTPAIVPIVGRKKDLAELAPGEALPSRIEGVEVDVAPATPLEQLSALSVDQFLKAVAFHPASANEATMPSSVVPSEFEDVIAKAFRGGHYRPPPDLVLQQVRDAMTVTCHVSPDAGWPTLKEFLGSIDQKITIAMYDFSAPHILERLRSSLQNSGAALSLILDPGIAAGTSEGPKIKTSDFTEEKVVTSLKDLLKKRFDFTWAGVKRDGKTTASIFPSAYHIKMAVIDSAKFWISSGNWQSSNQPNIEPLHSAEDILGNHNREWHVIVEHPGLARTYEQFIDWDIAQAKPLQVHPLAISLPSLIAPDWGEPHLMKKRPSQYFGPQKLQFHRDKPLNVMPLLTPDNYADHVLRVIQGAKVKLYFQNQYINIGKQRDDQFGALLEALVLKKSAGLDVRIILRDLPNSRMMLEDMQNYGFDMSCVRLQANSHTKGIVVDSEILVLGSHNWSNDGTLYNRDASLMFFDADMARYYEAVFLHDWEYLARTRTAFEFGMPSLPIPHVGKGALDSGTGLELHHEVVVPWSTFYED
ncbi:MAG TPA: phospholipase D-like domain-containing protein [Nitrospirales bacterium]|jgi:hypothetical protein